MIAIEVMQRKGVDYEGMDVGMEKMAFGEMYSQKDFGHLG